jgi:hypothetical protein
MAEPGTGKLHVALVVVLVGALMSGWTAWYQIQSVGRLDAAADFTAAPGSPAEVSHRRLSEIRPRPPRLDRYGNEIEDALAEYKIHFDGDVYERHSPDTAMPRIGRPEM